MSEHSTHAEIFQNSTTAISFHTAIAMVHNGTSILQKGPRYTNNLHNLTTVLTLATSAVSSKYKTD
jgi:hypothetical protein